VEATVTDDEVHRTQALRVLHAFQGTQVLDSLLESLIVVLDSFDRVLSDPGNSSSSNDSAALLVTCGRIAEQLRSAVTAAGLVGFGERGDAFEFHRYMVIDVAQREGIPEDTVVEVVRRGYEKGGKVFRPAEVIVARKLEEPAT
jgi:molecular chaperone GrpE